MTDLDDAVLPGHHWRGRWRRAAGHQPSVAHPAVRHVGWLGRPAVRHGLGPPAQGTQATVGCRGRAGPGGPAPSGVAEAAVPSACVRAAAAAVNAAVARVLAGRRRGRTPCRRPTAGIGVALLGARPRGGRRAAPSPDPRPHVVLGDVGLRVRRCRWPSPALAIGGLFATDRRPGDRDARRRPSAATPGGRRRPQLALVGRRSQVPGENSKTFQSTMAGNDTEQSELAKWVPLGAGRPGRPHRAAGRGPLQAADALPDRGLGQGGRHDPGRRHGAGRGRALPADQRRHASRASTPTARSTRCTRPRGSTPAWPTTHRWSASCTSRSTRPGAVGLHRTQRPLAPPLQRLRQVQRRQDRPCHSRADQNVTPQECADVHGTFMKKTVWMVHAWVVPGWESPQGVFSHDNLHVVLPRATPT